MSKPSAPKVLTPAGWCVAAVLLAIIGVMTYAGLRMHRGRVPVKPVAAVSRNSPAVGAKETGRVRASLEALPLAFEANQGQTDPQVQYMARGNGYTVYLTPNETVFALQSMGQAWTTPAARKGGLGGSRRSTQPATAADRAAAIRMHLVGGNSQAQISAGNRLPGRANYFIGADPSQWHSDVAQYARISYRDAYPGVDMAFYGVQKQLEFDFIVAPGASPAAIRLGVSGANRIVTDNSGNLILASSAGDVLLHKPVAYQEKDGTRQPVDARFVLEANNQVSFELGNYDPSRELVIDPSVSYATYLGGTAEDDGSAIAVDSNGNAYITGQTKSLDFPTKTTLYPYKGNFDVFVTELSSTGSLVYSTYIGGSDSDSGNAIAVDASFHVFVAGGTRSIDFPTSGTALQKTLKGGLDAFVFELGATGASLVYSTYLGGTGDDVATGIALSTVSAGDVVVVGSTGSSDFPKQPAGGIPNTVGGGFVTKLNSSGSALVFSSYIGGGSGDLASAVAVDASDNVYVTGATHNIAFFTTPGVIQATCGTAANCNGGLSDAFVSVIKPDFSGFVYSTFLGGSGADQGLGIAVDSAGGAYVTGLTQSNDFPRHLPIIQSAFGGVQDAFVSALNPTGTALSYSTYLGGTQGDAGSAIAIDGSKNVYVTGQTGSSNFLTAIGATNPTQATLGGGNDAFIAEISPVGNLVFATYLGGSGNENSTTAGPNLSPVGGIAVDASGANFYVTGNTGSPTGSFPVTTGAAQASFGGGSFDAFVAKYSQSGTATNFTVTDGALSPTSVHPGGSATATITVTSTNGFASAVTLACAVAPVLPKGPTCSFNPSSVTPPANATVTSTLTVSTTGSSALLEPPAERRSPGVFYAMVWPIGGITLVGLGLGSAGSRRRKMFGLLIVGVIVSALLLMPACSSSSSGGGSNSTPTGTYAITVTGTSGTAVATGSPVLNLTVD